MVEEKISKKVVFLIGAVSLSAFGFLTWLIYIKQAPQSHNEAFLVLPLVNCFLNSLSTLCLLGGLWAIRYGKKVLHGSCMSMAFLFSILFFICYTIYHSVQGDTHFMGTGWVRPVYFFILISHILATGIATPLILWTLFLAATRRFESHRRWAKRTYPLWLYVSVTGILIYVFLRAFSA